METKEIISLLNVSQKLSDKIEKMVYAEKIEYSYKKILDDCPGELPQCMFANDGKHLHLRVMDNLQFQYLIDKFPATNKSHTINASSKERIINHSYKLTISNPSVPNNTFPTGLRIVFQHKDLEVWLTVPLNLCMQFFVAGERPITDSEYHYFTGTSLERLRQMRVTKYSFTDYHDTINWYGGDVTLMDADLTETIMSYLYGGRTI